MKNPEQLRDDLDRYIELERGQDRRGDPNKEAKAWAGRLAEVDGKRARYQEMAAEDLISFEQLRAKLAELEEIRMTAEHELAMLKGHKEHVQSLERNRVAP
jgi:DNA repair ATPase RecN